MKEALHPDSIRTRGRFALCLSALLAALLGGNASAQTPVASYEGCEDAKGRPVASEMDATLSSVAASGIEQGQPVIRYNPQALPHLKPGARLFFYAHECARHTLGQAAAARTRKSARQADCRGIVSLARSGLVSQSGEVKEIQEGLVFTPEEWTQLPGPPRTFDLEACFVSALKMPETAAPSAHQTEWNACIRVCGDRLRQCQSGCRGDACPRCQSAYDECDALCGQRFPK